ncbi:hypothetical protein DVP47_19450 [Yersinia enterocolitica]|nr:hypothetical protein [Yersinia enterocolitica]EKN6292893.1 hypothetical protein [Yersinia enterocolitica]EKN6306066.1 hypothetical protein [Yersinia enterocolitica]EKN6314203.1 hypothetical protein [Yersinia enterocolitica]
MWISLCTTGYKAGFCCGMQQTVIFIEISGCGRLRTPYNAHPSTRRCEQLHRVAGKSREN